MTSTAHRTDANSAPEKPHGLALGTVVVGVDGSASGDAALEWVLGQRVTELHMVHAVEPRTELLEAVVQIDTGPMLRRIDGDLQRRISAIRPQIGTVEGHLVEERPSAALAATARKVGASTVVVGSSGHGHLSTIVGSNVGALIHRAQTPVIIVPNTPVPTTGEYIVGCGTADQAPPLVSFVGAITEPDASGHVHVVQAIEPTVLSMVDALDVEVDLQRGGERRLLELLGEDFEGSVEVVFETLLEALEPLTSQADLVVIASHHNPRWKGFLTGSVAHHLPALRDRKSVV